MTVSILQNMPKSPQFTLNFGIKRALITILLWYVIKIVICFGAYFDTFWVKISSWIKKKIRPKIWFFKLPLRARSSKINFMLHSIFHIWQLFLIKMLFHEKNIKIYPCPATKYKKITLFIKNNLPEKPENKKNSIENNVTNCLYYSDRKAWQWIARNCFLYTTVISRKFPLKP